MPRFIFGTLVLFALCYSAPAEDTGGDTQLNGVTFDEVQPSTTTEEPAPASTAAKDETATETEIEVTESVEESVEVPAADGSGEVGFEEKVTFVLNIGGNAATPSATSSSGKGGKGKGKKAGKGGGKSGGAKAGKLGADGAASRVAGGKGNKGGKESGEVGAMKAAGNPVKDADTKHVLALGIFATLIGTMLVSVYAKRRQQYLEAGYELVKGSSAKGTNEESGLLESGYIIPTTQVEIYV